MRPTSQATTDGATLIEMTVVLAILLFIAAAVVPRVVAMQQSFNLKQLEAKVARVPAEAENQAVTLHTPVRVRISSNSIVMEKVTVGSDGAITPDAQSEQIKEIDLGDSIKVDNAQLNGQSSPADTWQWIAYPDGTSDTGALEFEVDKSHYALVITDHAASQWIQGDMPDQTQDQWPAGELVQRT
jgi:Tfp pilus assembly protein FimT